MQFHRSHICFSSTSGLLLQPLGVSRITSIDGGTSDQTSHMFCGMWANTASIFPVDDSMVSFTSVEAVEVAAVKGKPFDADLCETWKKLSQSSLWLSSWSDFPKFAQDLSYTIMSLCVDHLLQ
jgi:hypothetical protein